MVGVSYNCMEYVGLITKRHNKWVTKTSKKPTEPCNSGQKKQLSNEWKL